MKKMSRKLICFILCAVFILSPQFVLSAQTEDETTNNISFQTPNLIASSSAELEDYIAKNTRIKPSYPFNFELLSYDNDFAYISFHPEITANYTFCIVPSGKKDEYKLTSEEKYKMTIGDSYSFVYTYTIDNTMYVYNGNVSAVPYEQTDLNAKSVEIKTFNIMENETFAGDISENILSSESQNRINGFVQYEIENNDTYFSATMTYDDNDNYGTIYPQYDEDWWVVSFSSPGNANFWLGNIPSGCDYDIILYDSYLNMIGSSSFSSNNPELITYVVSANTYYYIRIIGFNGCFSPSSYLFRAKNYPLGVPPDGFEPNNEIYNAFLIPQPSRLYATINYPTDHDYYRFYLNSLSDITINLMSIPFGCDYELELYNPYQQLCAFSAAGGNVDESIFYSDAPAGTYYVHVYSYGNTFSGDTYDLLINSIPKPVAPPIPANSIGVKVVDNNGTPIPNAIVYVYPQKYQSTMYPYEPVITNASGYAIKSGLTSNGPYGINVIANDYAAKSFNSYIFTSNVYQTIFLDYRSPLQLNDPMVGFTPINYWPHNSYLCPSYCSSFIRICPHTYMSAYTPQNFGWRYGSDSRLEFHQAVDVAASTSTKLYNIFTSSTIVRHCQWLQGCGNTIQLENNGLFATYMHLNSYDISGNVPFAIPGSINIGNVGATGGNFNPHMHLSLATSNIMWVDSITNTTNPNIIDWNYEQINLFLDPLSYIN